MKILVTGGLGFIGSNFILKLLKKNKNFEIINVDAKLYGSNKKNLESIENLDRYQYVEGDITNYDILEKIIIDCDAIVNFAAESFVDRSISNATSSFDSNLKGIFILLELIKKYKKRLIHISTDEVFGSLDEDSANEITRFNPSSPYSATKAGAELLINSYFITYGCDCVITRCTNNYGPRQFPEKLIPKIILLAEQGKKIPLYGTGNNIRDWIFVDDHCDAIFNVLMNGKSGESYNISANNEINNITIVKKILSIMNKSEDLIEFVDDRPGHDYRYSVNFDKISNTLGWSPQISFNIGIRETIEWYIQNKDWKLMIIGDDASEYAQGLKKYLSNKYELKKKIIFTGKQKNIRELLDIGEIYVQPTLDIGRKEGGPVATLEAMANGKIIIGSNISGIRDQLLDKFPDYLFPAGNIIELQKKLDNLMTNDKRKNNQIGEIFFNHVNEHYSISIQKRETELFYQNLIQQL